MIASGLGAQVNDTRGKLITQAEALKTVKRILEAHPEINARDDRGNSAVMGAVFRGWNDVIKVLIEAGADPYQANKAGKSAFDVAQAKTASGAGPARQEVTIDPGSAALIQQLKPIKTAAR